MPLKSIIEILVDIRKTFQLSLVTKFKNNEESMFHWNVTSDILVKENKIFS